MGIQETENAKTLKSYGKKIGGIRISDMVIEICREVHLSGEPLIAIKALGEFRALSEACKADPYLEDNMLYGFNNMLERAQIQTQ